MVRVSTRPLAAFTSLLLCIIVTPSSWTAPADVTIVRGIVYSRHGDLDLKLDIARPMDGGGPFPALIFLHGRGWDYGD